mgnify:CR=1 FL=1
MYERKSNSGHSVVWKPEDEEIAARSVAAADGTGVQRAGEAARRVRDEGPIEADDELARRIQEEYDNRVPVDDPDSKDEE